MTGETPCLLRIPSLDFRVWPDQVGDPNEIDVALVWSPPAGELKRYPNLKAILSLGAGIDALLQDATLPDLPLARMVDPSLTRTMADYVLLAALRHHRQFDLFEREQRRSNWAFKFPKAMQDRRVGVMGLGVLGKEAALALHRQGFDVAGWSRSAKFIDGIETFAGQDNLDAFLSRTEILVCLLPLTGETEGILNGGPFQQTPEGRLSDQCRARPASRRRGPDRRPRQGATRRRHPRRFRDRTPSRPEPALAP